MRRNVRWIVLILLILFVFWAVTQVAGSPTFKNVDTSTLISDITSHQVQSAKIVDKNQTVQLTLKDGSRVQAQYVDTSGPGNTGSYIQSLLRADPPPQGYNEVNPQTSTLWNLLIQLLPVAVLLGLVLLFMNQMQGGGSRVMNFGKSRAKLATKDMPKTTFADVAGANEAVAELEEIKEFLQEPAKFQAVGAKIPKGVLLFGPPGTGKTLLALSLIHI